MLAASISHTTKTGQPACSCKKPGRTWQGGERSGFGRSLGSSRQKGRGDEMERWSETKSAAW